MDLAKLRRDMEDLTPQNAASILKEIIRLYSEFENEEGLENDIVWARQAAFTIESVSELPSNDGFFKALDEIENPTVKMVAGRLMLMPVPSEIFLADVLDAFMEQACKRGIEVFDAVWEVTNKLVGDDTNAAYLRPLVEAMSVPDLTADNANSAPKIGVFLVRMSHEIEKRNSASMAQIYEAADLTIRALSKTILKKERPYCVRNIVSNAYRFSLSDSGKNSRSPYEYYRRLTDELFDAFCDFYQSDRHFVGVYFFRKQGFSSHDSYASKMFAEINGNKDYKPTSRMLIDVWREYAESAFYGMFQLMEHIAGNSKEFYKFVMELCGKYFSEV